MGHSLRNLTVQSRFCYLVASLVLGAGCGSSSSNVPSSTAAAVQGEADTHCGTGATEIKTEIGMCVTEGEGDAGEPADGGDAAAPDDGGTGGGASDFGDTEFNAEGDDDDCKYHVSWKSTEVKKGSAVTFDVTLTRKFDGKPATGADVAVEAFLSPTHPTPSTDTVTQELPGGVYRVGPVVLDESGQWTVRFHFYEMCSDAPEDSPHGHVAFFVKVP